MNWTEADDDFCKDYIFPIWYIVHTLKENNEFWQLQQNAHLSLVRIVLIVGILYKVSNVIKICSKQNKLKIKTLTLR